MLTDVYTTPGGCDEAVRIFLARGLSDVEGERFAVSEEEADMEQARIPLPELVRSVLAGDLHNNCLVVGALALTAVLAGDGVDSLRPAEAPWPARPFEGLTARPLPPPLHPSSGRTIVRNADPIGGCSPVLRPAPQ